MQSFFCEVFINIQTQFQFLVTRQKKVFVIHQLRKEVEWQQESFESVLHAFDLQVQFLLH